MDNLHIAKKWTYLNIFSTKQIYENKERYVDLRT